MEKNASFKDQMRKKQQKMFTKTTLNNLLLMYIYVLFTWTKHKKTPNVEG